MIAQDQRRDLAWRKAFGKWHKSHHNCLEGVQKPHRSKALGVAEGPVYYKKDFRLHSSLSPKDGNTSYSLEQAVTLLSNWRIQSGMNSLWCCLHWACSLFWGYLLPLTCGPLLPTTQCNLYGFLLQKPFWTGQDRIVPSEYLSQQACLSAEPELLKRWTSNLLSLTWLWLRAVWKGLHRSAGTKIAWGPQGENPSLTASLQMTGTFSVMWLCDNHIVSLQTPKKKKIGEGTGEQEDNWEDTFYTLLWVLQ